MTSITFKGKPLNLIGELPAVGSMAPDFTITKTDMGEVHLANYKGTRLVLNLFPSLDTPTCAAAMAHFNEMASEHPNVIFLCISADLPFAQQLFCSAKHFNNVVPASIFRHKDFGTVFGIKISDGPFRELLARAVIIIDENGIVEYTQLVKELNDEPDYEAIRKALKNRG